MIERRIIIGLITSTEFTQRIKGKWNPTLLESATAKRLATWCNEYFEKYDKAPGREIEPIFYQKVKIGLPKELAEEIEEEILPDLSKEFEEQEAGEKINIDYLVDQALAHFNERNLLQHSDSIRALVETNKLVDAERLASSYLPVAKDSGSWIDLSSPDVLDKVEQAFTHSNEQLITFPGALGEFWNDQMVRGGFVALLGAEKRGKTFWLLELAIRARKQGRKVAFFQAGDMSEPEQLKRIAIYLTKKSNKEKYCGQMFEPVKDCILNQLNKCHKKARQCSFGIFDHKNEKFIRQEVTMDDIKVEYKNNPQYETCTNCPEYAFNRWGAVWTKEIEIKDPLTVKEAKDAFSEFFVKHSRNFKLSTHANSTLTVKESEAIMDIWEKQDGFIPDVIIYDYPDIMEHNISEFRHKQNEIWKGLRGVSQKRKALTIVVTQADADSYTKDLLKLENFSEDKRKYGHVTAFYGLNQDHTGREKELGIMRINEIVVRDGDFSVNRQIRVLQNLRRGRPFLTSYW